jgi:hypothetical protein
MDIGLRCSSSHLSARGILIALMTETAGAPETSVTYHITRLNTPENSHLHTPCCENLKYHKERKYLKPRLRRISPYSVRLFI